MPFRFTITNEMKNNIISIIVIVILCSAPLYFYSCSTGVESSPQPGIVRITLQSNPLDTAIIIQNDTSRFSPYDRFDVVVSQGKVYRDTNFAPLYKNISIYRPTADTINIIKRENFRYVRHTVFESYVPPGRYNKIQFSVTAKQLNIYWPKDYEIPIQLPAGTNAAMDFTADFLVSENKVTQVDFEIDPFLSLTRYLDSYVFSRRLRLKSIHNY